MASELFQKISRLERRVKEGGPQYEWAVYRIIEWGESRTVEEAERHVRAVKKQILEWETRQKAERR